MYTSKRIDDLVGGTMGRFNVSYRDSFDVHLEPNANYVFNVSTQNITMTARNNVSASSKYV